MVKNILFRGKMPEGKWVYGYYCCLQRNDAHGQTIDGGLSHLIIDQEGLKISVIPETVGQYTGFTDQKQYSIFEDDIVEKVENPTADYPVGIRDEVSSSLRFWLSNEDFGWEGEGLQDPKNFVVIGNIHDNPELLN